MDHNPFITRNNDLFIMLIAGVAVIFVNNYVLPLSIQQQFMATLVFGFMSGLFMNYLYQSIEWALFFTLGILFVSLLPWALQSYTLGHFQLIELIRQTMVVGKHSLVLLSSWIIAIPAGYILQKLMMGNYYRSKSLL